MSKIVSTAKEQLEKLIKDGFNAAIAADELPSAEIPSFTLEKPADRTHGDWATNAAMAGARAFHAAPRKIAEAVTSHMELDGTYFDKFEIAGPGFINFFLSPKFYGDILEDINTLGDDYGKSDFGKGQRVLVEFVSANPTGPMHIGNARGGAIGDCLASVLEEAGYNVDREFYVNDAGNQVAKFGLSLDMRYKQLFDPNGGEPSPDDSYLPEDSYHGQDIIDHARNFADIHGAKYMDVSEEERRTALINYALPLNIKALETDLKKYRIVYDRWFLESSVHKNGDVDKVIDTLTEKGYTYEKDGAVWFKATEFGNEKDIVLRRENGFPTYIVPDIAYHYDKLVTRGYDKAINIWGADHHGYVPRLKGALTAYGADASKLDIILMQMVRILIDGQPVKQSKRSGKAITLHTLLEEVPIDAARFFFNLREANSMFDFDYDLAVSESSDNPVYYVQYAHARICSILRGLEEDGVKFENVTSEQLKLLTAEEEIELINALSAFTDEVISAAKAYDPSRITKYVINVATLFHKFYNSCRVRVEDNDLMQARIYLCKATKTVIKNVLEMFKITIPEKM